MEITLQSCPLVSIHVMAYTYDHTDNISYTYNNNKLEAGNMVQQLRAFAAHTEVPGLAPNTHIQQLTTVCDSSYRVSDTFSWLLQALCIHDLHTEKQVHTHTNK